jgi:predicted O-methyltransferase YrrM
MQPSILQLYLNVFRRVEGWFSYDAALMFMAYNQLIAAAGISGDTLEIGVYYGLSAIAIASLRGHGRKMYAIDLFEHLGSNVAYGAGQSYRAAFETNMRSFFGALDFLVPIAESSGRLRSSDFPHSFSFCHVDGGHSPEETCADLTFASDILLPGGLLALDDYFNPQNPGVCEGALDFRQRHTGVLQPVAIGFNKVLFCKCPSAADLNGKFSKTFPQVPHLPVGGGMWGCPVYLFGSPLRDYFDLYASKPNQLVAKGESRERAAFVPERAQLRAQAGRTISLPVVVENVSDEPFPFGPGVFGLSYHLLSDEGHTIRHDNPRTWLEKSLQPSERLRADLKLILPSEPGRYKLEIDLVWEGIMWFKDIANHPCLVDLEVF